MNNGREKMKKTFIAVLASVIVAVDAFHASGSHALVGCPQYWTPQGEDTWVGDVSMLTFNGRLHLFYLKDRHHHGVAEGMGCHGFGHISATSELTDWMEYPDALPVTEWWQSLGTGTPFVKDGKLCLAYGLHTERVPGWKELKLPAGATWAESEDGIHFKPSGVIFHETRNPTVFNREDGLFGMIVGYKDANGNGVGGMLASKDLREWKIIDAGLPGKGDCPCYFIWNGHHYLLQGFTQFFHSKTGVPGSWENWAEAGDDPYDGLSVPMVCEIANGRRILAGWIRHPYGWGGWLAFRELRQRSDGRIDMCWPSEMRFPVAEHRFAAGEKAIVAYHSVCGHKPIFLSVDPVARTAEWKSGAESKGKHAYDLRVVSIRNVRGLDSPYRVKVIAWYDERHDVTIFDAEIAGKRTLVTRRFGRYEIAPTCPQSKND